MTHPRLLVLAVLSAAALAGCGGEIRDANEAIDRTQDQIEQVEDAVTDPVGAAEREARERLDEATEPLREAERQVDRARDVLEDPAGAARDEADRRVEDAISPEDQP